MVRTTITSKGQTTVPFGLRKRWRTSRIIWDENPDGSAIVRPAPDVMEFFGVAANDDIPRDPKERDRAIGAMSADADQRGAAR